MIFRNKIHFIKSLILCICLLFSRELRGFDKVVIWGHKLHTHTHSYVHNAFFRAFQAMHYPIYWFDDSDKVSHFDFTNTLFITEGQVDHRIPIRDDCEYILHNCHHTKYRHLFDLKRAISLQVYTDDVLTRESCKKIASCIYYDVDHKCVYMPWATDLLPSEIDSVKKNLPQIKKTKVISWVGTIGGGYFGNEQQIHPFEKAARSKGHSFIYKKFLSLEENLRLTASSYMAPAIVGAWQKEKGYIPCRIFKNISYGQMGITNSPRVYELFEKKIVYNEDSYQLFFDAEKRIKNMTQDELYELIDFVKNNHTYINRIETLLDFFNVVKNS